MQKATKYEVLLVVDGVRDKDSFDKHLKKEGFRLVEGEDFAYEAKASLPLMNTRAYIFDVLKKALKKSHTKTCHFIFSLGDNPLEKYAYESDDFKELS